MKSAWSSCRLRLVQSTPDFEDHPPLPPPRCSHSQAHSSAPHHRIPTRPHSRYSATPGCDIHLRPPPPHYSNPLAHPSGHKCRLPMPLHSRCSTIPDCKTHSPPLPPRCLSPPAQWTDHSQYNHLDHWFLPRPTPPHSRYSAMPDCDNHPPPPPPHYSNPSARGTGHSQHHHSYCCKHHHSFLRPTPPPFHRSARPGCDNYPPLAPPRCSNQPARWTGHSRHNHSYCYKHHHSFLRPTPPPSRHPAMSGCDSHPPPPPLH